MRDFTTLTEPINLNELNVEKISPQSLRTYDIAIDGINSKIYWATRDDIQRANFDGTNVQDVVTGLDEPEDIAIDVSVGKIYWTIEHGDRIQRANLDGTNAHVVAIGVSNPTAIGLHDGTVNIQSTPTAAITDAAVSISPASITYPAVGQQLELSLKITDGEAVAGYQATVQFDRTLLRYVSSSNGDYLPAGAFFVEPTVEGNLVKLNAASLAGESTGNGTLATITFQVIAVKRSTLTLSDVLLTDTAGEAFVPTVENAEITESIQSKGDTNGEGIVNILDLVLVASNLGKTGQNTADVNGDRIVNIQDLVLVAGR